MRVLVTGAFGNVGTSARRELAKRGHDVRSFDLPTRANRRAARQQGANVAWGDIRSAASVAAAVADQDVVIHLAAIIPPVSEAHPDHAREVNVEGTRYVVAAAEGQAHRPRLIYASTAGVFGPTQHLPAPRSVDDPVQPNYHYTRQKVEAESLVRGGQVDWAILRFGAVVPFTVASRDPRATLRAMFAVPLEQRIELVHTLDLGVALANAVESQQIWGRVLLMGGGASCQVRQREAVVASLDAMGIGLPDEAAFTTEPYYMDWLDTAESQALLNFQRRSLADYRQEMERSYARARPFLRLAGPVIRRLMAAQSPHRR